MVTLKREQSSIEASNSFLVYRVPVMTDRKPCLEPMFGNRSTIKRTDRSKSSDSISRLQRTFWGSIVPTLSLQAIVFWLVVEFAYSPSWGRGPGGGGEGFLVIGLLFLIVVADFFLVVFTGTVSLHVSRMPALNLAFVFARGLMAVIGSSVTFMIGMTVVLGLGYLVIGSLY